MISIAAWIKSSCKATLPLGLASALMGWSASPVRAQDLAPRFTPPPRTDQIHLADSSRTARVSVPVSFQIEPYQTAEIVEGERVGWSRRSQPAPDEPYFTQKIVVLVASNTPWQVYLTWSGDPIGKNEEWSYRLPGSASDWQPLMNVKAPIFESDELGYRKIVVEARLKPATGRNQIRGFFVASVSGGSAVATHRRNGPVCVSWGTERGDLDLVWP